MRIDQGQDPGYRTATIGKVGFADPYAVEGLLVLQSEDGRQFHMRAFSGEVARHILDFVGGGPDAGAGGSALPVPTIYRMVEEICENAGLALVKVKLYESGQVLRANLYLTGAGGREIVLRGYRASDAAALASFYGVPILVKDGLLRGPGG